MTDNQVDNTETGETNEKKIKKTDDIKQYMREYRKNNTDKWSGSRICEECGNSYTLSNLSNHLKSNKHKYAVMAKENAKLQKIKEIMDAGLNVLNK